MRKLPSVLALTAFLVGAAAPLAQAQPESRRPRVEDGKAASLLFFINPDLCPDTAAPCFGYEPAFDRRGNPIGRWVPLNGDIDGLNFEPGVCAEPLVFGDGSKMYCLPFDDERTPELDAGSFRRALPGDTAFTRCNCTVGDSGDPHIPDFPINIIGERELAKALRAYDRLQRHIEGGRIDSYFTLRIQYFAPTDEYPAGYTEFDMFNGRGRLRGLFGTGILDFAGQPPITFTYLLRQR